jgi:hypothetical protein
MHARWYRQPVAWLAVVVLLASIGVVVATIVVAERLPAEPVPVESERLLKAPVSRERDEAPPPADPGTAE